MARRRASVEQDWRDATTASALLSVLYPDHRTPPTPAVRRKLRLALCGAARTIWDRLPHDDLRAAVEVAERFADGWAIRRELDEARQVVTRRQLDTNPGANAHWVQVPGYEFRVFSAPGYAAEQYALAVGGLVQACCERSVTVARTAGRALADFSLLAAPLEVWTTRFVSVLPIEVGPDPAAAVVRDLFAGPTPVRFAAGWTTGTVVALAAGIAADAAFDRLPVLADALDDAGCDDERVLAHCRGPGPHWRGCWVVDGVLGK